MKYGILGLQNKEGEAVLGLYALEQVASRMCQVQGVFPLKGIHQSDIGHREET